MNIKDTIISSFDDNIEVINNSRVLYDDIENAFNIMFTALSNNNKVIIFGNGGSAADAQHFSAELISRYKTERKSLPAIALTTDTSILTAIGNDYGFEYLFSRQCESLVQENDVAIAITTSGTSKNVLKAIEQCKKNKAQVIVMTGNSKINFENANVVLSVQSTDTPRIQEGHRLIMHTLCQLIDDHFSA